MGVPKYFAWLLQNYKKTGFVFNKDKLVNEEHKELLDEVNSMDYFLIDANCLIHPVCFKVIAENPGEIDMDKLENRMIVAVLEYLDKLIAYVSPKKGVYIAIDGVAPVAKIKQQRMRRFKSVADKIMWDNIKKKHNRPTHDTWNNNAITPGTKFMVKLNEKIIQWADKHSFMGKIIYSSCFTPAEGEHKLLQFIRTNTINNIDMSYVIYGLDADLIFLALSTNSDRIYLLREANEINKKESYEILNYVSIKIMRTCIHNSIIKALHREDMNMMNIDTIKLGSFETNQTNIVNDFIFMCYFLGNDFLPHIPCLDIAHNGIETLIEKYADTIHSLLLKNNKIIYLLNNTNINIDINMNFLSMFINKLALSEHTILNSNYNAKKRYMKCDSGDQYDIEVFKIDNLQFKINDPIMLGSDTMEEYRKRYYNYYWGVEGDELEQFSKKLVDNYMLGIRWVTLYYFDKCPSWTWFYPFDYPPFITDINMYLDKVNMTLPFKLEKPIQPFMQLLCVLPPQSSYLISKSIRKLMLNPHSQLAYAYPMEFKQDFINKSRYWMGIPTLPPLDLELVKHSFHKYKDELNSEEKIRNGNKDVYIFEKK